MLTLLQRPSHACVMQQVNCLQFSPDGSFLVSGSDDRTAVQWDVLTGRYITAFANHRLQVTGLGQAI